MQAIGSVELAAVPSPEDALPRAELDSHSATIYSLQQPAGGNSGEGRQAPAGSILLVVCTQPVLPERASAWVRGLFAAVQPGNTLVLSAMPVSCSSWCADFSRLHAPDCV